MPGAVSHPGTSIAEARVALAAMACAWLLAIALTALARQGPTPETKAAPRQAFSAARAVQLQRAVVGDGTPRSPGSEADSRALEQIAQALTRVGLQPELQHSFVCGERSCGNVTNLIAHMPGRAPGSVLLVAHHDSVAAGPGASDDAAGVAVLLETARALATARPLQHGVTWLFTDAEETGCLGARAFAAEHPYMADARAVINVDNGGTSGPVLMYGTGTAELARVELYARAVRQPASSSLLSIGHRLLPRDSDFRVFRERGLSGLDLAYAAGEARYHTALDSLEHASRASLQQQGDHVLACARALADSELSQPPAREAAWFDVFGVVLVRWPADVSVWLALATLGLLALVARPARLPLLAAARLGAAGLCATALSGLLAWAVQWLLVEGELIQATFVRQPGWLFLAMLGLAAACLVSVAGLASARTLPLRSASLALWLSWALLAGVSALVLPGASVLFLPLPLTAAIASLLLRRSRHVHALASGLAALSAGAVYCPVLAIALDTFGVSTLVVLAAPVAWLGSTLLPGLGALSRRARAMLLSAAGLMCLGGVVGHVLVGNFDALSPARVNVLAYSDVSTGERYGIIDTSWVGPRAQPPAAMRTALAQLAGRAPEQQAPLPWRAEPALRAKLPAGSVGERPVQAELRARAQDSSELQLQAAGNVRRLLLLAAEPGPIHALRLEGRLWPSVVQPGEHGQRYRQWSLIAPRPVQHVQLQWVGTAHASAELWVVSESAGVPRWLEPLLRARPRWASASQSGDRSIAAFRLPL